MPRPSASGIRRTRGSWTPRIVGISAVVLVAASGAVAYLVASPAQADRHRGQLSSRVQSFQTVGLVGQVTAGHHLAFRLLADSATGPVFGPMPPASLPQGDRQWTADTMVGGNFVFIYAPTGRCLAVTGRESALTLQRCDLGASQRWERTTASVQAGGHQYDQYRNLGSGQCLTTGAASGGSGSGSGGGDRRDAAGLAACAQRAAPRQLISFWWAA